MQRLLALVVRMTVPRDEQQVQEREDKTAKSFASLTNQQQEPPLKGEGTMRVTLYRLGMWLLRLSGAGVAAWRELERQTAKAQRDYYQADHERWNAVHALNDFRRAIKTADGLLSSGQPEKAQATLRVALVASRDVRRAKVQPLGFGDAV